MKKILSIVLTLAIVLGTFGVPVFAEEAESTASQAEVTEASEYAAYVGETGYDSLQGAIDAAESGAIYIHSNADEDVTVSANDNTFTGCTQVLYNDGNTTDGDNITGIIDSFTDNTADGSSVEINESGEITTAGSGEAAPEEIIASVTPAYVSTDSNTPIWGEGGGNAKESLEFKLFEDETVIATTTLNNVGGIIDGDVYVTWSFFVENTDEYWTTTWAEGYPKASMKPDTVKVYVDGVEAATNEVRYNAPDDLNKIVAAVEDDGKFVGYYTTLADAIGKFNGRTVYILRDVEESIDGFYGVTLTTNVEGGVTVTDTNTEDWIDFDDVTVDKNVTVNIPNVYSGDSENLILGTLNVGETYYHGYDAKTTIKDGGKVTVGDSTIIRYNEDENAGIYIYGDGDDSTVEFDCNYYIGSYSGTFYAENANIEEGYYLLKNSYDDSNYADIELTLDNSDITITGTSDGQDSFIIDDQAHLTLKNNSSIEDVRDFSILSGANLDLNVDATSSIGATNVTIAEGVPFKSVENSDGTLGIADSVVASIGETGYATLAEAFAVAQDRDTITLAEGTISEGTVKLPAVLKNVTVEGANGKTSVLKDTIIESADGTTLSYENITFDGIVFNNSSILVTGWRSGAVSVKDWTITNCEFKDIAFGDDVTRGVVHFNLSAAEALNGFTYTNNVVENVAGKESAAVNAIVAGDVIITNNTIKNTSGSSMVIQPLAAADITISGNELANWGMKGAGRAIRAQLGDAANSTLTISENALVHSGDIPEQIVKIDGTYGQAAEDIIEAITLDGNYWNGVNPGESGIVIPAEKVITSYYTTYTDGVLGDLVSIGLSGSGTAEDPYLITNLDDLKWFRDDVNSGNNYGGKFIKLGADINLASEEWTPIGTADTPFKGTFDGGEFTISNLKITHPGTETVVNNVGLFGKTNGATIKNLTVNNASVTGSGSVAAVVGNFFTGTMTNVHLTGKIQIAAYQYVGGLIGWGYASVNNCSVKGDGVETSIIKKVAKTEIYGSGTNGYVGGICGWIGEGNSVIDKCSVSDVTITTNDDTVGGICGIMHYGNSFTDCALDTVSVTAPDNDGYNGIIAGHVLTSAGSQNTYSVTVNNVTATADGAVLGALGSHYDSSLIVSSDNGNVLSGSVYNKSDAVASIGGVNYFDLQSALKAAKSGDTITLCADIAIESDASDMSVPAGVTIDGAGYTLTLSSVGNYGSNAAFCSDGAYTVKNLTIDTLSIVESGSGSVAAFNMVNGGALENVTVGSGFEYGVHAGNGVTVTNCTFNNEEWGIYADSANDVTSVTGSTFNSRRAVALYGVETFTGNTVNGDKGLSLSTTGATVTGNTFTGERAISISGNINGSATITGNKFLEGSTIEVSSQNSPVLSENYWSAGYSTQIVPDGDVVIGAYVGSYYSDEELKELVEIKVAEVNGTQYATLQEALKAAKDGETVKILTDFVLKNEVDAGTPTAIDKDITLDLNGKTIQATGHVFRIEADVTVKNGTIDAYDMGYCFFVGRKVDDTTRTPGNLVIESGTYIGQTSVVSITEGLATILGGKFSVEPYQGSYDYFFNCVDSRYPDNANVVVKGGTFAGFNPADNAAEGEGTNFVAEGYTSVEQKDGSFLVGMLPDAEVANLGGITVTSDEGDYQFGSSYHVYDLIGGTGLSSATEPFDMSIAMQFVAKDSEEAAAANAFGQYTTDFFITITGLENDSFVGDGCYLAGYYPSFGAWVKIPLDGFPIEDGKVYPVITSAGFDFSYETICSSVQDFICGIYLTDEVIAANPNINVNLTLGLSEDAETAQSGSFVNVDAYDYVAADFKKVAAIGTVSYPTLADAFAAAKKGDTITLLDNITVSEQINVIDNSVLSDITLDGNGKTITHTGSGKVIAFGDETKSAWATGVKIKDLTIDGTDATASQAIKLTGGTSSTLTNVVIEGDYAYAINFYGTHGATLDNCKIVSAFTNGQDDYPLNLNNGTVITTLVANDGTAEDVAKIFIDETSSITTLYADDHTKMLDVDSAARVGTILEADTETAMVASIDGVLYSTLQLAVDNAEAGDTVKLLDNITLDKMVTVPAGKITLDLDGKTIDTSFTAASGNDMAISVSYGADLTITDSSDEKTGTIDGSGVFGAVKMTNTGEVYDGAAAKLTVDGGTLIGQWYAIVGNGGRHNTEITINGGVIKAENEDGLGIFHPQDGTLTISGGEISGAVGVEMRSGTLNMTGGSITSTDDVLYTEANDSGATVAGGAAVVLSQHTSNKPVSVNISGGTLSGTYAFYQDRLIKTYSPSTNISATIGADVDVTGDVAANEEGFTITGDASTGYKLEVEEEKSVAITYFNLGLGNDLSMNFYVAKNTIEEDSYVLFTKEYADGAEPLTKKILVSDAVDSGDYYKFTFDGLAAKEMGDNVSIVFYNSEDKAISDERVTTFKDLCLMTFEDNNSKLNTLLVDMLNYGAYTQEHFNYNVSDLVNADLTEEQRAYGTGSFEYSERQTSSLKGKTVSISLELENNIQLNLYFEGITDGMYGTISYVPHNGTTEVVKNVTYSDFVKNESYYKLSADNLVVADYQQLVTFTIYNSDGSVYEVAKARMEDYGIGESDTLSDKIMIFAKSAYNYLHR